MQTVIGQWAAAKKGRGADSVNKALRTGIVSLHRAAALLKPSINIWMFAKVLFGRQRDSGEHLYAGKVLLPTETKGLWKILYYKSAKVIIKRSALISQSSAQVGNTTGAHHLLLKE